VDRRLKRKNPGTAIATTADTATVTIARTRRRAAVRSRRRREERRKVGFLFVFDSR
jgi:hypothetical protein